MFSRQVRALVALGTLSFLAACTSTVGGTALPAPGAGSAGGQVSASADGSDGQITQPSVLPTAAGTSTPSPVTPNPSASGLSTPSSSVPASGSRSPAPPAAALSRFYDQRLAWGGCASFATSADDTAVYASPSFQCAHLTVPLAYADPTGPTVTVGVLRRVATDPAGRIGSLVIDPGGPGGSGMSFTANEAASTDPGKATAATATIAALNARFDLVGIDPRGVGSSVPAVQCETDAEKDADRRIDARSRTAADVAAATARLKKQAAECEANTGKSQGIDGKTFLANVGTRDVARDLDVLRAALGDAKLTYLGFSYGTKIGWEYAEQFPGNVRAILFDGDLSPIRDPATLLVNEYKAFQSAFDSFAQWCALRGPLCPLGTDPAKALGIYQSLVRPLLDHPVPVGDGRTMSFTDATVGTTQALYDNSLRPALAQGLTDLKAGKGDYLMALADEYDERDSRGHYSNAQEALYAVDCVDGPTTSDPAVITKLNAALAAAAPFLASGDPAGALADLCSVWPVPPTLFLHRLQITGLPKTLVISTTGDPATPYADGVELASEIGATLLTVKAVRHTSYLNSGDQCTNDIGTAYLITLALPAAGTTCD